MIIRTLLLSLFILAFASCVPENKRALTDVNVDLQNMEIQRLINYRNAQQRDSILAFKNHDDPSLRYLVAESFASFQDPLALDHLYSLLYDPILEVRQAAAFAIGQIGKQKSQDSLLLAFRQKDTISVDNMANSTIIEAMGKTADPSFLKPLSTVSTYRSSDTLLLLGQARGIYRFMLREQIVPEGTSKMVEFITTESLDDQIRLVAAHYLARAKNIDIESFKFQISQQFIEEDNVDIKMALAIALGKTEDKEIQDLLIEQLKLNQDYRVTINIIRSLKKASYIKCAEKMLEFLRHDNHHIAIVAADFFAKHGNKEDAGIYRDQARDSISMELKSKLYTATYKSLPYYYSKTINSTRWQIQKELENLSDPKDISLMLESLAHDPLAYEWVYEKYGSNENVNIKTAAAQSLASMVSHPEFDFYLKSGSYIARKRILKYLTEAMEGGDEGIIGIVANVLIDEKAALKTFVDSTNFLLDAKSKLKMPGQVETIHAVEKALGYLNDQPNVDLSQPNTNHPIDWEMLKDISLSTKAMIKTNKGVFTIDLLTKEATSSVLNFIKLSEDNFYDSMVFHRVVPNFVIQTGSPRGDNYGGKDYTIKSEFSQLYYDAEGYVGMASAGPHTESTQWFVTHSPTPHLDGRYTIFGKVIEGMDVVHKINRGDQIIDIIITNL